MSEMTASAEAPAATTSAARSSVMPPMATIGLPRPAGVAHEVEAARRVAGVLGGGEKDRPDGDVAGVARRAPRRSARGRASRRRQSRRARRSRAPPATGRSVWPTWTPSAPRQPRDVGAIVDDDLRAGGVRRRDDPLGQRRQSSALGSSLARSCSRRAPPRRQASASASGSSRPLAAQRRVDDRIDDGKLAQGSRQVQRRSALNLLNLEPEPELDRFREPPPSASFRRCSAP